MDREDMLQIQLPVSALGTLARLLEQVQRLTVEQKGRAEADQGSSFDPERFRILAAASAVKADAAPLPEPSAAVLSPPAAGRAQVSDEDTSNDLRRVPAEPDKEAPPDHETAQISEAGPEDAAAVGATPGAGDEASDAVSAAGPAETVSPESAPAVGAAVGGGPDQPHGGHMAMVEELVTAGPAPLTAQAVSMAFQRDDRRYDAGFPLYQ